MKGSILVLAIIYANLLEDAIYFCAVVFNEMVLTEKVIQVRSILEIGCLAYCHIFGCTLEHLIITVRKYIYPDYYTVVYQLHRLATIKTNNWLLAYVSVKYKA